ncbi:MAG: redoxin domain-containing protein [Deltaproteobacteria bacterium]|nr:redoxin domain-containing protein [Deltaproteobacteria bacterium]
MQLTGIRKSLVGFFLVVFVLLAAPAVAVTLHPGDEAPNFSLKDIDGNKVSLGQFRGKTVVIAFWSTWCSRCEEELTFLKDSFGKRNDVVVLLVNQDSEKSVSLLRVRTVKEKLGITFPILMDEGLALWDGFGINALPTSVVIGKNGVVKMVESNFYWASPEKLIEAVEQG